jgi:hypothetical protein
MTLDEFLRESPIRTIRGMPMGRVSRVFLHVILQSDHGAITITGEAMDMPDRTEAFFLTEENFDESGWKTHIEEKLTWPVEDLTPTYDSQLKDICDHSRLVRYYIDREDALRGLTKCGPLDSAAALELVSSTNPESRLVLYATPEYPCSVELATTPQRCDEILSKLEELTPAQRK